LAFLSTVGGLVGVPYAMSSMLGMGDVNKFEHVLEPVIAEKSEHKTATHGEEKKEVKHFFASEAKTTEHAEEHNPEEIWTEQKLAILSVVLAGIGIIIGFIGFKSNPLRQMPKLLENKWYIDEIYNKFIIDPITNLSRAGLWKGFDLGFIDGAVNGIGSFVGEFGQILRRIQVGFVRSYAAIILFGALIVIGYFVYYGFKLLS
jgi:NADH-quinone oxidoreductase subunit L